MYSLWSTMRAWGKRSQKVRDTLDPRLGMVVDRLLHEVSDISLLYGYRNQHTQNDMFDAGMSKLRYPDSKHNNTPSLAVDLQPYPYPSYTKKLWGALGYIAGHAIRIGTAQGVRIRWGGDWDEDGSMTDQNFDDLFHLEIVE